MPRKHCRTRVRSRGRVIRHASTEMVKLFAYMQDTTAWAQWRFRTVSRKKAEQLVADGDAEIVSRMDVDGEVRVVGYRALKPNILERPTPCTLTMGTMKAVSNAVGEKKDVRISRRERRQIEKFMVWPLIGDTKAVAVRPKMYDHERAAAESVLRQGYLKAA